MPTLQFKGKNVIWNHHLSIPYHTLEEVKELHFQPEKGAGNLIIEGDNLIALKALLPLYAGHIKCICIDPPYNIGNENWIYNDKVNSPLMRDWIGKIVGKDDLTKHDKWLCMMVPRLKLLYELLDDDGVIFISIDDNELNNLLSIMDEIFGTEKRVGILTWFKKRKGSYLSKEYVSLTEYVVIYKKKNSIVSLYGGKPDEEESQPLVKRTNSLKELSFKKNIVTTKLKNGKYKKGYYGRGSSKVKLLNDIEIVDGKIITDFILEGPFTWSQNMLKDELDSGATITINTVNFQPRAYRIYPKEHHKGLASFFDGRLHSATTDDAYENLQEIFNSERVFEYSKPMHLLSYLIQSATYFDNNSIVLDSFAGTGTTFHAVMELNKQDSGNRKCILVQMREDNVNEPEKNVCRALTRERVKRSIEKYEYERGFKYLRVGKPIDAESLLSGDLPDYKQFAKYVYYLCTGENLNNEKDINEKKYFVGEYGSQVVYLIYKQDFEVLTKLALTLDLAENFISEYPNKRIIVYAPSCFVDQEYLEEKQIDFVSIPYNLFQRNR